MPTTSEFYRRLAAAGGLRGQNERLLAERYDLFLREGDHVLDVGAADGIHTRAVAARVGATGSVLAVEPLLEMYGENLGAVARQDGALVAILQVALGAEAGTASMTVVVDLPGYSGLRARVIEGPDREKPRKHVAVRVETIDRLYEGRDRLDYVKIDIEGGETDCIRGGITTIQRLKPIISFEHGWQGYSAYELSGMEIFDLLKPLGYDFFDLLGLPLPSRADFRAALDAGQVWDFWAVPTEKIALFQGCRPLLVELD